MASAIWPAAIEHLQLALEEPPSATFRPVLRALRLNAVHSGSVWTAIDLFDVEGEAAPSAAARADLLVEKAEILEHRLLARGPARAALEAALTLVPGHASALLALEMSAKEPADAALLQSALERRLGTVAAPAERARLLGSVGAAGGERSGARRRGVGVVDARSRRERRARRLGLGAGGGATDGGAARQERGARARRGAGGGCGRRCGAGGLVGAGGFPGPPQARRWRPRRGARRRSSPRRSRRPGAAHRRRRRGAGRRTLEQGARRSRSESRTHARWRLGRGARRAGRPPRRAPRRRGPGRRQSVPPRAGGPTGRSGRPGWPRADRFAGRRRGRADGAGGGGGRSRGGGRRAGRAGDACGGNRRNRRPRSSRGGRFGATGAGGHSRLRTGRAPARASLPRARTLGRAGESRRSRDLGSRLGGARRSRRCRGPRGQPSLRATGRALRRFAAGSGQGVGPLWRVGRARDPTCGRLAGAVARRREGGRRAWWPPRRR